jgi:hypothetical protein
MTISKIRANRHREERSDAAIQEARGALRSSGLLRRRPSGRTGVARRPMARNDVYDHALSKRIPSV